VPGGRDVRSRQRGTGGRELGRLSRSRTGGPAGWLGRVRTGWAAVGVAGPCPDCLTTNRPLGSRFAPGGRGGDRDPRGGFVFDADAPGIRRVVGARMPTTSRGHLISQRTVPWVTAA